MNEESEGVIIEPKALFLNIKKQVVDHQAEKSGVVVDGPLAKFRSYVAKDQEATILVQIDENAPAEIILSKLHELKNSCGKKQEALDYESYTCKIIAKEMK